jgi:hypothetical protein
MPRDETPVLRGHSSQAGDLRGRSFTLAHVTGEKRPVVFLDVAEIETGRLREERDALAAGLRGLARMVADYCTDRHSDGDGVISEPDESDPICHLWNAVGAIDEDPGDISTWLYAEHGPGEDDAAEKALITAGEVLAALDQKDPSEVDR